ncbi:hypothetical protein RB2150_11491 [Rhodobacteraceae bacterium HTCC2150]|nr:hypothetical protein RB2150_11491 [Rhodobacteraceae bacterium HTCC2150]
MAGAGLLAEPRETIRFDAVRAEGGTLSLFFKPIEKPEDLA